MSAAGRLRDLALDFLQTLLRMVPWPTEPGLRAVGQPGPLSPVLVTGNYDLTVRRVLRALEGCDAWLVVAPSSGINVWCAAAGGHLGTHQVVTALKTSGVEQAVRHRRAILPQLAATGVRAREVSRRCGWHTRFGPVAVEDLPRYLADAGGKTQAMRRVRFGPRERLEMALAWGGPAAAVAGGLALLVHPPYAAPIALLALLLGLAVFFGFDRAPSPRPLWFGGGAALAAVAVTALAGGGGVALATAFAASLLLFGVLTFDYAGSTPVHGGSHFEERSWRVVLDPERCEGVYTCWEVCPEACFEKPSPQARAAGDRLVRVPHADRCVRCGACVVQCPMDALAFEDARGARVEPDVVRRFKLNLLGRRSVDLGGSS